MLNFDIMESISSLHDALCDALKKPDLNFNSEFPPNFREDSEKIEFTNAEVNDRPAEAADTCDSCFAEDDLLDFIDDCFSDDDLYTPDFTECTICGGDGIIRIERDSAPNYSGGAPNYYDVPIYCDACSGTGYIYL